MEINKFYIDGTVGFDQIDVLNSKSYKVDYDLNFKPAFFSVNFPLIYSGDILSSNLQFFA